MLSVLIFEARVFSKLNLAVLILAVTSFLAALYRLKFRSVLQYLYFDQCFLLCFTASRHDLVINGLYLLLLWAHVLEAVVTINDLVRASLTVFHGSRNSR